MNYLHTGKEWELQCLQMSHNNLRDLIMFILSVVDDLL